MQCHINSRQLSISNVNESNLTTFQSREILAHLFPYPINSRPYRLISLSGQLPAKRTQNVTDRLVIARRLREARLLAGVSQKTLGILAGIDEFSASARVNQYERGRHTPDFMTLEKFAGILNIPTEFFYARDDTMAEMLLVFATLPHQQQVQAISRLKKLSIKR